MEQKLYIFGIVESWLKVDEKHIIKEILPEGFSFKSVPRTNGNGGGLLLVFKSNLKIKFVERENVSFEQLFCEVKLAKTTLKLLVLYRPPPNKTNGFTNAQFLNEFSDSIGQLSATQGDIIICGDFNVHFGDKNAPLANEIEILFQSCDLKQHVLVPTHTAGHCLDWIISRNNQNYILNVKVQDLGISDHSALLFDMQSPVIDPQVKTIIT